MKPTLDWLIHESALKELRLLTCPELAGTEITGVNILDNPDTTRWFRPGELVLTTGYLFLDHEELQLQIFQDLKKAGCSALCLKTKRFFSEIPPYMLRLSEELRLPLIELPYYYSLADVISTVDRQLYYVQDRPRLRPFGAANYYDSLFRYLLEPENASEISLPRLCEYYGIPYPPRAVCAVAAVSGEEPDDTQKLAHRVKDLVRTHELPSSACFVAFNRNLLCLFLFDDNKASVESLKTLLAAFAGSCEKTVSVGTGPLSAEPLLAAFQKAVCMASLQQYFPEERLFLFHDYYLFWQITKLSAPEKAAICEMTVQPLADCDAQSHTCLIETLLMYYRCRLNSSLAASRLYIHRNTFLKRMEKIQSLMEFHPEHPGNLFSVYYGLCVHLTRR